MREIGGGGLYVAMVVMDAHCVQGLKLVASEQTERGTEVDVGLSPHLSEDVHHMVGLAWRQSASAGDERETVDTLGGVVQSHVDGLLSIDERILLDARVVNVALCAPLAILGASARASVDDGAGAEAVASSTLSYHVGGVAEGVELFGTLLGVGHGGQSLSLAQWLSVNGTEDALGELVCADELFHLKSVVC